MAQEPPETATGGAAETAGAGAAATDGDADELEDDELGDDELDEAEPAGVGVAPLAAGVAAAAVWPWNAWEAISDSPPVTATAAAIDQRLILASSENPASRAAAAADSGSYMRQLSRADRIGRERRDEIALISGAGPGQKPST